MNLLADREAMTIAGKKTIGKISLIIPITERHDELAEMLQEYRRALDGLRTPYEVIFVVDVSFDKGYRQLKAMKEGGENFTIIKQAKAFGESAAIMAGFRNSTGDVILLAPPYHQVEMEELPKIVENLDGFDMVIVRRWPRTDSRLNQLQTTLFQRVVRSMAGSVASDIGCGVRLFRREILEEISLYGDHHRFLPILAVRQGFKVREVDIRQSSKERRLRTYTPGTYLRRLIDLLTIFFLVKFTKKPLRFFGLTGTAILTAGLVLTSYLVFARLFFDVSLSDRPVFLIGILFIVLGLQIFAIGLIGEIIIFTHAREMKDYHIEEIIN
jgi:glycosyltransferase involved in cell wall biosynthesis